jgi:hypothetical protein
MNRRHLAVVALIIAVPLFAAPLVSPVPDYGPHLQVATNNEPVTFETEKRKENVLQNETTMRYQNLSASAKRFFDTSVKYYSDVAFEKEGPTSFPLAEAPEPWATLAPADQGKGPDTTFVYVVKNGQYYSVVLFRFTPGPSLQELMLRLGPLLAAIGLGTVASYLFLTAEE